MKKVQNDTKKIFKELGTCSRTFFYLLNREFGHPKENEEHAADPLAGGIVKLGKQCGMLWGATLAIGAEAFRRSGNINEAVALAINASMRISDSFVKRAKSMNCRDITRVNLTKPWGLLQLMFKAKTCFNLAETWTPEAIESAITGLKTTQSSEPKQAASCATEVLRKMGANDEEMAMVAGFAGGIGLSGNGCGALGAAIWYKTLKSDRIGNEKSIYPSVAQSIVKAFFKETGSEIHCYKLTDRTFKTIDEHTEFVKSGGCSKLICMLAEDKIKTG